MHLRLVQRSLRHLRTPEMARRWFPRLVIRLAARVLSILALLSSPTLAGGGEPGQANPARRALPDEPKLLEISTAALSDEDRAKISGHIGNLWANDLETLSEDDARVIASVRGPLSIQIPSLSLACAQELAKHRGSMSLSKLTTLSDEAAEALGRHHGDLSLFGCHTLSVAAMQHLARGNATELGLDIIELNVDAARALAQFKGKVEFYDLSRINADSAEEISSRSGELRLRLSELTPGAAKALARKPGQLTLILGRADEPLNLTAETAEALRQRVNGDIRLEHVTFEPSAEAVLDAFTGYTGHLSVTFCDLLTDEAAQALARLNGSLIVSLPKGTPAEPIRSLAAFRGDLCIFGLTDCPDDLAEALAKHHGGELKLNGMQQMSESAAAALAQHAGPLELSFRIRSSGINNVSIGNEPPSRVVNMLCRRRGTLRMPASWVRPDTIDSVLAHVGGLSVSASLHFNFALFGPSEPSRLTWDWMPLDLFERLVKYPGPLRLGGELTDEMAPTLATRRGDLAVCPPKTEEAANSLLTCEGRLFLGNHWTTETIASAKVFASEKNRTPVSTATYMIGPDSVEIASILVQRKGPLSLPKLRYVKADALRILATKHDIRLPPLDRLYILSEDGKDVAPAEVVSPEFLKKNAENQPPPEMPEWHSWEKLLSEHE